MFGLGWDGGWVGFLGSELSCLSVTNRMTFEFSNVSLFISIATVLFRPIDCYILLGRYFTGQRQNSLFAETTVVVTLNTLKF